MLVRPTESNKCKAQFLASQLVPRASESARLGLVASQPVTLEATLVHLIPKGVWVPFGNNMHTLLIRQSDILLPLNKGFLSHLVSSTPTLRVAYRLCSGRLCHLALYLPASVWHILLHFAAQPWMEKVSVALLALAALANLKYLDKWYHSSSARHSMRYKWEGIQRTS